MCHLYSVHTLELLVTVINDCDCTEWKKVGDVLIHNTALSVCTRCLFKTTIAPSMIYQYMQEMSVWRLILMSHCY